GADTEGERDDGPWLVHDVFLPIGGVVESSLRWIVRCSIDVSQTAVGCRIGTCIATLCCGAR
ncbi:hypothetical protein O6387_24030, partial [Salmonella enterica subsp. enterica]